MTQAYKIGMVGAPSSGKSTYAAMLYAELLQRGINSTRLIMEVAAEHLGGGGKIETIAEQMAVVNKGMIAELVAERRNFNPLICDGALFIGEVYMNAMLKKYPETDRQLATNQLTSVNHYMDVMHQFRLRYDVVIYCPLSNDDDQQNTFRIHSNEQAKEFDKQMLEIVESLPKEVHVFKLDTTYYHRTQRLPVILDYIQANYKQEIKDESARAH